MTEIESFDVVSELRLMKRDLKAFEGDVKDHIHQGEGWRKAIVGIVFAIILQVVSFAYIYGQLTQRVYRNESVIDKIIKVAEENRKIILTR